jgi:hypothetical protein
MGLHRDRDVEPVGRTGGSTEIRHADRSAVVAVGSVACPECDAPVALTGPVAPSAALGCPFCGREGRVREFLSLGAPTRPARVVLRIARG